MFVITVVLGGRVCTECAAADGECSRSHHEGPNVIPGHPSVQGE